MLRHFAVAGSLVACLGLTAPVDAKTHAKKSEANEVKVKFDQLSDAVKKTFEKEAPGATIAEVDQEKTKAGKSFYEADVMIAGKNWEIRVAPDGKLISKKLDNEKGEKKH